MLGCVLWGTPALAITCEAAPPTQVIIESRPPQPTIDVSLDLATLARRAGIDAAPGGATRQLGLTTARLAGSFVEIVDFAQRAATRGPPVCGAARTVTVSVGVDDAVIHVAREMTRDRCLYDQVLAHEQRHVQVDREVLAWAVPRLEAAVRASTVEMGIVRASSQEAVWTEIRRRLQAAVKRELDALERERRRRQQLIDRLEELNRFATVCDGALRPLLGAPAR